MPFYREEYDTIAQRIYEEALPGYNIVGIDCDNNGNNIISLSGAIHCITHSVGVNDPLLISYKKIEDVCLEETPYVSLEALVKHRSGINEVFFNYKEEGDTEFTSIAMQNQGDDIWSFVMSFDNSDLILDYYVHAIANNGKEQYRPMTALEGGINSFVVGFSQCEENTSIINNINDIDKKIIKIVDIMGRDVQNSGTGRVVFLIFDDGSVEKQFIN